MLMVDEALVKDVLGNYKKKHENIRKRIRAIQDEIVNTDSILESVSLKKLQIDPSEGSVGNNKDLLEAMLKHQKLEREYSIELIRELHRLIEEEEGMNRIMVCFRALRGKEYTYIERLYVQKLPYKTVELESGYSHSRFEAIRANGLKRILKLYKSPMSNVQISRSAKAGKDFGSHEIRKGTGAENPDFEQLTLNL